MLKIYLAGPDVFYPDAHAIGEYKKQICLQNGFQGVYPLDLLPDDLFSDKYDNNQRAKIIKSACIQGIRDCDMLVANMTPFRGINMDVGTANEMGAAYIIGKKVYGYSLDSQSNLEKVKSYYDTYEKDGVKYDSSHQIIEDFDKIDNCMVTEECEFIVYEPRFLDNTLSNNLMIFEKTIIKIKESLNV